MAVCLWLGLLLAPGLAGGANFQQDGKPGSNALQAPDAPLDPSKDAEIIARHPLNDLLIEDPLAPDATATLGEIAEGVREYQRRLTSLRNFWMHSEIVNVEQGVDSEYGHPIAGFGQIIARKEDAWLAMRTDWEDEIFVPYYAIWRDGISLSQEYRHFSIVRGPAARFSRAQYYTYLMGVDILREMPGSQQLSKEKLRHSFLDRDFLQKLDHYQVLPKQQQIDGAWCHVVQYPGFQTMWIDTNQGFVVRQLVYNWRVGGPCERVIQQRDFREIDEGLLFPFSIVEKLYAQPLSIERPYWNQITATLTIQIKDFRTSDLDPQLFNLPISEGTEVYDFVRKKQFVVAHQGEEPFYEAIQFARSVGGRSWTSIGLAIGALGGLILACMFARKAYLIRKHG